MGGLIYFKKLGGHLATTPVTVAQILSLCDCMHAYDSCDFFFFLDRVLTCVAEAGKHSSRRSIGTCRLAKLNLELDLVVDLLHFEHILHLFTWKGWC